MPCLKTEQGQISERAFSVNLDIFKCWQWCKYSYLQQLKQVVMRNKSSWNGRQSPCDSLQERCNGRHRNQSSPDLSDAKREWDPRKWSSRVSQSSPTTESILFKPYQTEASVVKAFQDQMFQYQAYTSKTPFFHPGARSSIHKHKWKMLTEHWT